jgi:hypothetical protein
VSQWLAAQAQPAGTDHEHRSVIAERMLGLTRGDAGIGGVSGEEIV